MQTFSKHRAAGVAIFAILSAIFSGASCAPGTTCLRYSDCAPDLTCAAGKCVPPLAGVPVTDTDAAIVPVDAATADVTPAPVDDAAMVDDGAADAGDETDPSLADADIPE